MCQSLHQMLWTHYANLIIARLRSSGMHKSRMHLVRSMVTGGSHHEKWSIAHTMQVEGTRHCSESFLSFKYNP